MPKHCLCNRHSLCSLSKPPRLALRRETEKNASRDEQQDEQQQSSSRDAKQQQSSKTSSRDELSARKSFASQGSSLSPSSSFKHSSELAAALFSLQKQKLWCSIPIGNEKLNEPKRISKGMKYTYMRFTQTDIIDSGTGREGEVRGQDTAG